MRVHPAAAMAREPTRSTPSPSSAQAASCRVCTTSLLRLQVETIPQIVSKTCWEHDSPEAETNSLKGEGNRHPELVSGSMAASAQNTPCRSGPPIKSGMTNCCRCASLRGMADQFLISSCQCGKVRCKGAGRPILSGICYCDDCQAGAAMLKSLGGAAIVSEEDGGTHYLTYRDDRFSCVEGAGLLQAYRLSSDAPTRRMVASCCNTPMFLKYAKGHWTSAYARRFKGHVPSVEMRTQTQFRNSSLPMPDDAPAYRTFGLKLFWRLFASRVAMILG